MANRHVSSRYEGIWEKVKSSPNKEISVKASPRFHATLKKAIIKRKNIEATKNPGTYLGKLEFSVDDTDPSKLLVKLNKIII